MIMCYSIIVIQQLTNCQSTFANKRSLRTFYDFCPIGRPIDGRMSSTLLKKWRVGNSGYRNASISFYFSPPFVFDPCFFSQFCCYWYGLYCTELHIRKQDRVCGLYIVDSSMYCVKGFGRGVPSAKSL